MSVQNEKNDQSIKKKNNLLYYQTKSNALQNSSIRFQNVLSKIDEAVSQLQKPTKLEKRLHVALKINNNQSGDQWANMR